MPQVQIIEAFSPRADEKEKVAAYCRVSTDSADQLNSYKVQIGYYTDMIQSHPNWELADIYADRGISGTLAEKREEFQRMLADCRSGKINRILVKSVSRFARNTMELIETTRELKELGVVIVFEEQGFDTSQMLGEMQLTLSAMAAQEESVSIGDNVRWSVRKRMQAGTFIGTGAPYGYRLVNGTLEIEPSEAKIVREIFSMYLSGVGKVEIAKRLNAQGVPSHFGKKWAEYPVRYILSNERYVGDALLQKYYVEDTLNHKQKQNKGDLPQYYVTNRHEPIISREMFTRAQELMKEKAGQATAAHHLFVHRIQCPDCGAYYREITSSGKHYWNCPKQTNGLEDCTVHRIPEEQIKECFLNMVWKLYRNADEILRPSTALLREIAERQGYADQKLVELNQSISGINEKLLKLSRLREKGFLEEDDYQSEHRKLSARRQELYSQRRLRLSGREAPERLEQLEQLLDAVRGWNEPPTEFTLDFFDSLIEKIIPTADKLCFHFHCGLELKEALPT